MPKKLRPHGIPEKAGDLSYPQPVTLTWEEPYNISSMRVMWWADGGGVQYPKSCNVQYFDYEASDWKDITNLENEAGDTISSVGIEGSGTQGNNRVWNSVAFTEEIKTTGLRLNIERNGSGQTGVGIGEWEVYGKEIKDEFLGAKITGKKQLVASETSTYYAGTVPSGLSGEFSYTWSIPEDSNNILRIEGDSNSAEVSIKALAKGEAIINLSMTSGDKTRTAKYNVKIDEITEIEPYKVSTIPGKEPILPDTVAAKGIIFDDPAPSLATKNNNKDFGETFDSKLVPVTWNELDEEQKEVKYSRKYIYNRGNSTKY